MSASERTPLLGVSDAEHSALSARRQSLNALATGRQSVFGRESEGLAAFREIVRRERLLSRSDQRTQDLTEQVKSIIHDEPGLVAPRQRLDVTTNLKEAGLLTAWVGDRG